MGVLPCGVLVRVLVRVCVCVCECNTKDIKMSSSKKEMSREGDPAAARPVLECVTCVVCVVLW